MHCDISGSGLIPLVCLHGWACDGSQFRELAGHLGDDFRIYCPDLPGHGRTPLGSCHPGFEAYTGLLVEFIRQHRLDRPVLLGHSMGGILSLIMAASDGVHARAVIDVDGSLPATDRCLAGQKVVQDCVDGPDFRPRLAELLHENFFLPSERDVRSEMIVRQMCASADAVLRLLPQEVGRLDSAKILPKIVAPVLYVGGASPRFDYPAAVRHNPGFRMEQIPGVGHFIHIYAAGRLAGVVKTLLEPVLSANKQV